MAKLPKPYFPEKPIKLDYIYFHVGRNISQFGAIEQGIDACLRLFAKAAPDPLYVAPVSAKRRITAFKRFLNVVRITDQQRAAGRRLIAEYKRLSIQRNWLAHGITPTHAFIGATWRKWGGYASFEMRDHKTGERVGVDPHLSELEKMGDEVLRLGSDIWDWLTVDLGAATPKKTEKVIRKISVRTP